MCTKRYLGRKKGDIILKLFLDKQRTYENTELAVLMVLNGLHSKKHDYLFTSVMEIAYTMTGYWIDKRNSDRRLYNNIKNGLSGLADKEYIKILDVKDDNYVISNDGLEVDTEKVKFTVVELWEMQKIFNNVKMPFNVFTFFVNLVETINGTTKEWHMPQDDMAYLWGCSKRTVNDYLNQLVELKLIYVYKHKKRKADGTYHKINNSYGRYADRECVIEAAQDYVSNVECVDFFERIDRRSIKLRYNAYCDGAKKYKENPDLVLDLYKECLLYNKSLKNNPVEGVYDGEWKKGEALDLSVFPDDIVNLVIKDNKSKKKIVDQWGEADPMIYDFNEEEILEMPTLGGTQSDKDIDLIDIDSLYETDDSLLELY